MTEPTNAELMAKVEALSLQMRAIAVQSEAGFVGVNLRLDKVNGQLDKHSTTLGTHAVTLGEQRILIQTLKEQLEQVVDDAKDAAASVRKKLAGVYASLRQLKPSDLADEKKPLTRRELTVLVAGFGLGVGLFEILPRILSRVHP